MIVLGAHRQVRITQGHDQPKASACHRCVRRGSFLGGSYSTQATLYGSAERRGRRTRPNLLACTLSRVNAQLLCADASDCGGGTLATADHCIRYYSISVGARRRACACACACGCSDRAKCVSGVRCFEWRLAQGRTLLVRIACLQRRAGPAQVL